MSKQFKRRLKSNWKEDAQEILRYQHFTIFLTLQYHVFALLGLASENLESSNSDVNCSLVTRAALLTSQDFGCSKNFSSWRQEITWATPLLSFSDDSPHSLMEDEEQFTNIPVSNFSQTNDSVRLQTDFIFMF